MANLDGSLVYVFNNHTGNVEALYKADSSNELLAEYEYTPFGETRRQSGDLAEKNPLRYSTRYHEGNTGLYYYGFRHYSPVTKKWLSQDPIEELGGLNLYRFANNNPVNFIDALGMCCELIVAVGHGPDDEVIKDNPDDFPLTDLEEHAQKLANENPNAKIVPFGCNAQSISDRNNRVAPNVFPKMNNLPKKIINMVDSVLIISFEQLSETQYKKLEEKAKDLLRNPDVDKDPELKETKDAMNALLDELKDIVKDMCENGRTPDGKKCENIKLRADGSEKVVNNKKKPALNLFLIIKNFSAS